ncbi:MAG TPA: protein kinase [Pyrinomonadaceae bacterium]|jgi:serine/threonine-protein kinase
MNQARWQKVRKIFDVVVELAPSEREKFLVKSCGADDELRREVENLLDSDSQAESFLENPAAREVASLIIEKKESLETGTSFGHYEIVRQIGAGGMGEVYLAEDTKLDRRVALKILNEQFSRHGSNLERFIKEAKSASALNHPNILVIHEIGASEDSNYIVSEFIEGETLRENIGSKALKLSEVLEISSQIAGALVAAHAAKIVHRDIKPENVMIRPDGFVKILDFGLAKLVEQKNVGFDAAARQNETAKGMILGTVNYMSPEQAKGETVDERTDIFSFGGLLYEMIAGRTPFAGDSMSETFANLINSEPPPLAGYSENVPDELQRIVAKTLRKKRDERYQTMKDLLADLKSLRENLAFDEKLEKSRARDLKNETGVFSNGKAIKQTAGTSNSFTGQIRRYQPLAAVVLIVLIGAAIGGYYLYNLKKSPLSAGGRKSLAVLPFVNAGQDPNAEYLADGVTESLTNNLSQLSGLKVMSRNSAFRFKNNQGDTKNIAAQLGVETLVTGDIRLVGDKLFINVHLIDAADDSQIWGNQYIKTSTDVIAAQNEIAQAVANNLRLKLSNAEQQKLGKNYTENPEAYQNYQRGRFHVFKLTPAEVNQGISYFQKAIELDPSYALAYAGLSDSYRSLALGSELDPPATLAKAKAAAQKAVEIDDALSDGHTALGMSLFWGEWNWSEAENQFKRALELNPNDVNAHIFYAHLLSNLGRHTESLAEISRARELDPLFPFAGAVEGQFLLHAGRADEALDRLRKTFELAPNFWMPHLFASSVYTEKGMFPEAIAEARKARELSPAQTVSIAWESYALAKSGKRAEAQAALDELLKLSHERYIPASHLAIAYYGLGETDKALDWLEKAYAEHDPKTAFLKVDPKWNNLRNHPRFIKLMQAMQF